MRYSTLLILFITLLAVTSGSTQIAAQTAAQSGNPPATAADDPRYRIELIVLMHLDHSEEPRRMRWLEDYSAALDLLTPEPEEESGDAEAAGDAEPASGPPGAAGQGAPDPVAANSGLADGDGLMADDPMLPEEPEVDPFGGVVHVPEPGAEMQEAWRRLRLSGPFRPLQYLAWEQSASAPFPVLRLHDGEAVLVQDPWAEERAALEAVAAEIEQSGATAVVDAPDGDDPDAVEEPGLPPPIQFFRLDGTAQLTRSRFLHLALNVEWREPIFEPDLEADFGPNIDPGLADRPSNAQPGAETEAAPPPPDAFDIHRLEQSRQVRLRRMEYFDWPVLGVLAWVTRVNASTGQEEQATDEADLASVE